MTTASISSVPTPEQDKLIHGSAVTTPSDPPRTVPRPTDQFSGELKDPALTAFLGISNDEADLDFSLVPPILAPLYIGYERLDEWVSVIDPAASVYVYLLVEQKHTNEADRRIDHHRLIVGQPDARNRVHYCRMTLATLVYINGVPFDPEHAQVITEAKRVYEQIAMWLQRDFTVWHGMVAMPEGLIQAEGVVPHNLLSLLEESESEE